MSSIIVAGDTSGSVTLSAPLVAGTTTLTLPSVSGNILTDVSTQSTPYTPYGLFYKPTTTVAFTKTGAGTATTAQVLKVEVNGVVYSYASGATVVMPALTLGTDYAIYACTDGTVRADSSFTNPTGYTTANSRQIGGFHYAIGGVATAQAGGDTTPAINAYSIWDLKFKPRCADPRGMALISGRFWADIYMLGVDYLVNGSSSYNKAIATGAAPPKVSTLFGGNGTTTYANGNWWNLGEALCTVGKRHPTYLEYQALAYGTTEATASGGTLVATTGITGTGATSAWNIFTSKFGIIQATGCVEVWGDVFGGGAAGATWVANTDGRGSTYQLSNAALFGGHWGDGANAGSRYSTWSNSPTSSAINFGARGVCDHLVTL